MDSPRVYFKATRNRSQQASRHEGYLYNDCRESRSAVYGIAILDHFSCGISGIIPNCNIAVFSGPAGSGVLAFRAVFLVFISHVIKLITVTVQLINSRIWDMIDDVIYQQRVRGFYQGFQTPRNR